MEIRTKYNRQKANGLKFEKPSMTKQSFKDECDINNIMRKYQNTGQLPAMIKSNPTYGDFSKVGSYQESLHVVMKAQEQFDALSSKIRRRFDNDPAKFLEFCNNKENREEMIELGLIEVKKEELKPIKKEETPKEDKKP